MRQRLADRGCWLYADGRMQQFGDEVQENEVQENEVQENEVQESKARELPVAPRWFEVTEIADGVFRITEPYVHAYVRSNAWLIRGSESHLLVDSGLGVGRLPDELAEHLDRPVIAVATHAHFDHFGGLAEFADRAAHRDDGEVIAAASRLRHARCEQLPDGVARRVRGSRRGRA